MTQPDKLYSIDEVIQLYNYGTALHSLENKLAKQLLDTMRENDRLKAAIKDGCEYEAAFDDGYTIGWETGISTKTLGDK